MSKFEPRDEVSDASLFGDRASAEPAGAATPPSAAGGSTDATVAPADAPGSGTSSAASATPFPAPTAPSEPADDLEARVGRIESMVRDIRAYADLRIRESQHADYSIVRILAGVLQGLAAVVFLWCVVEYAFVTASSYSVVAIKGLFAVVLQLMALTALLWDRRS
jgi:hypothetical protein